MSEVFLTHFATGLGQVVGVFLGVVAGVCITFAAEYVRNKRTRKQELANLRFELDINIAKIDAWLKEVTKWRNAINADNLLQYFGHFNLSSAISATTNSLFIAGKLYNALTNDHIAKLQEVFKDLSVFGEQYLNNQIQQKKQLLSQMNNAGHETEWQRTLKPQCAQDVDFWETKLKSHQDSLLVVKEAIDKKIG
ncbi:MAG: hypothetical protein KJ874_09535 [Acidobacteria bacterium]|nr:hypothetical protein [Acidobacteriota bacterium]